MKKKDKIVILGGCGYLGAKLFEYLVQNKFIVDTVDLEWYGNSNNSKNIKKDYSTLTKNFFKKYSIVILLAGHSTVSICEQDPSGAFKNNVSNFVDLVSKLSHQKLIYASSYRVYQGNEEKAEENTDDLSYSTIYDLTKSTIDHFAQLSNVDYYGLRMATVNGYSPNLRNNQVINKLYENARITKQITIQNPSGLFSVLGIQDFCRVIEEIVLKNGKPGLYNIASFSTTVGKISELVEDRIEKVKVITRKGKAGKTCVIDSSKFEKIFKFKFQETPSSIVDSLEVNAETKHKIIQDNKLLKY